MRVCVCLFILKKMFTNNNSNIILRKYVLFRVAKFPWKRNPLHLDLQMLEHNCNCIDYVDCHRLTFRCTIASVQVHSYSVCVCVYFLPIFTFFVCLVCAFACV